MALRVSDLPPPAEHLSTQPTYTVEEWLKMPVKRPYTELVEGKLKRMPAGSQNHWEIISNLSAALKSYVIAHELGRVGGEINVLLEGITSNNGWIPDLAFASKTSRLKIGANWEGVPDWVLEVWAGGEKRSGRIREKRERWQRAGVPELWEIIWRKDRQEVKVYQLIEGIYQARPTDAETICSEVIEGFCIERAAIFANLVEEEGL